MNNFDSFIADLSALISFESVMGKPEPNAPFGKQVAGALDCFLDIAKRMGFSVVNHNGYIGEITFGEGQEIGIIGHLDVVPVSLGWNTHPFTLTEKEGVYFGRGVVDDKGPTLLALYALNELKNSGEKVNKKFRLFVGTNEESGWKDVDYYRTIGAFPENGFSPDGNFPLTYSEKGIIELEFCISAPKNFSSVTGGSALNAVCDYATCIANPEFIDTKLLERYSLKVDGNKIQSFGKAAHGSTPHLGKNAIKGLLEYLCACGEDYQKVVDCLFNDAFKLSEIRSEQGYLTISPNLIRQEGDKVYITCDCRFPYPLTVKGVAGMVEQYDIPFTTKERHPAMYAGKDGYLVSTLINAYNAVTGENAQPVAMGGSTFARAFKFGCSFGPEKGEGGSGNIHDANEFITKEHLLACYKIYKKAIFDLAK